jgi:osmotically-inducible protein OsmY
MARRRSIRPPWAGAPTRSARPVRLGALLTIDRKHFMNKTDSQSQQDVNAELQWEPAVFLLGVTGVSNQIRIKPTLTARVVKSDIEAALLRSAVADARNILVEVHGADVTLSGSVHHWAERETATHSAWGTPGVRNVVDKMRLSA